jgi:RNA polymerase sigma factor (sigma-70 family)
VQHWDEDDLFQDVMFNLVRRLQNGPIEASLSTVIYKSVYFTVKRVSYVFHLRGKDLSPNVDMQTDADDGAAEFHHPESWDDNTFTGDEIAAIMPMINKLHERERIVLQRRYLPHDGQERCTLQMLADEMRVSKERVRQLEERAIRNLKKLCREHEILSGEAA